MAAAFSFGLNAESWRDTAARLAAALISTEDVELRLAVVKRIAKQLGEDGYPGFLKLLLIISESNDDRAKGAMADTLALALKRMDLPSGQLTAWGTSHFWNASHSFSASAFSMSHQGSVARRSFGPVEYLTVWYCQKTQRPYLGDETYQIALAKLINLLGCSPEARQLYPAKIQADLANAPEGAYTRQTRSRLTLLVTAWQQGKSPEEIARAAVQPDQYPSGVLLRNL